RICVAADSTQQHVEHQDEFREPRDVRRAVPGSRWLAHLQCECDVRRDPLEMNIRRVLGLTLLIVTANQGTNVVLAADAPTAGLLVKVVKVEERRPVLTLAAGTTKLGALNA